MPFVSRSSLIRTVGRAQSPLNRSAVMGALCLLGTVSGCSADVAAATQASAASTAHAAPNLKVVALPDPSFNGIPAVFVAVPKDWKVSGQMSMNPCVGLPNPSWNASSSDGQSSFEVLPEFAWRLGNGVRFGQGCDPLKGTPSAADFLTVFAAKLPDGVKIVGRMPVADTYRIREEKFTQGANDNNAKLVAPLRARSVGDVASLRATDSAGHELRLRGWVQCSEGSQSGNCFARVDVLRTPRGKLDALIAVVDGPNLIQEVPDDKWLEAFMARQQHNGAREMQILRDQAKAGSDMLHQQYVDSSARLKGEHEAGLQQIERTGQDANAIAFNNMNARSTASSDWRDYAADQQTVSGVNGTYKTSSQYSNVWSSPYGPAMSDGRTFGSMDNTVNPNTATDNTWTQDTKVHGNGQAY